MGASTSLSSAGLRLAIKAGASKIAGRAPDPAVTARPLVHAGRGARIAWAEGRIGDTVRVRSTGGGPTYNLKNHGTAPAFNIRIRTSRRGLWTALGDLPPGALKPIKGVQVSDECRFWLEWTEADGGTRKVRKMKPIPMA